MRTQSQMIFFILCVNIAAIIAVNLQVPGVSYAQGISSGLGTIEGITGHFNATAVASRWSENPFYGFLDAIVGGVLFFTSNLPYLLFGYAIILQWIGSVFIQDAAGQTTFNLLVDALVGIFSFLAFIWIIEVITGRSLFD